MMQCIRSANIAQLTCDIAVHRTPPFCLRYVYLHATHTRLAAAGNVALPNCQDERLMEHYTLSLTPDAAYCMLLEDLTTQQCAAGNFLIV